MPPFALMPTSSHEARVAQEIELNTTPVGALARLVVMRPPASTVASTTPQPPAGGSAAMHPTRPGQLTELLLP